MKGIPNMSFTMMECKVEFEQFSITKEELIKWSTFAIQSIALLTSL